MEGCTDGTWQRGNVKYFDCPDGRGLYYPLEYLQPDERYSAGIAVDGNRECLIVTYNHLYYCYLFLYSIEEAY